MAFSNYGELKTSVANWINRTDLAVDIPDFIRLAEAEIFRFYAARNNEVTLTLNRTGEDPVTGTIPVPADYREMLNFTVDDIPLERVSLTDLQSRLRDASTVGEPKRFARELDNFLLQPFPDAGRIYKLNYYAKLTPFNDDADTNSVLLEEPGLYLYGSLIQAEPFLRGDQLQLVTVWKESYESILAGVGLERDEEDRSGSNVEVQSAFGSRGSSARTGWA